MQGMPARKRPPVLLAPVGVRRAPSVSGPPPASRQPSTPSGLPGELPADHRRFEVAKALIDERIKKRL
jgi:hypothetical protein